MPLLKPWKVANISLRHCKWQDVPFCHPRGSCLGCNHNNHPPSWGWPRGAYPSYKVYSTTSAQVEELKKKVIWRCWGVPLPSPCLGHRHCWHLASTNTVLVAVQGGTHSSPATAAEPRAVSDSRAGGQAGGCRASCLLQPGWGEIRSASSPAAPWPTRGNTEGICP